MLLQYSLHAPRRGRNDVRNFMIGFRQAFPDLKFWGAADLIAGGRLQLGISRGSPEQVIDGWRHFGYSPAEGESDADMGRRHAEVFLDLLRGVGFAAPNPRPMFPNPPGLLRLEPHSDGLRERIWWGASSNATAVWAAKRDPLFVDVVRRHLRYPAYLGV